MSFLNAVINNVEDEALRESLQDRADIILHKIKFMDSVPVSCLDTHHTPNRIFDILFSEIGVSIQENPAMAKIVIYHESQASMLQLMGMVPALLEKEWPAVEYNRVYLMDDASAFASDPESMVAVMEDLAEMIYPGYFIFGNEGKSWMSFGV